MAGDAPAGGSVALADWPWPALSVEIADGTALATAANEPFRSRFGDVAPETPVQSALAEAGILPPEDAPTAEELAAGHRRLVRAPIERGEPSEGTESADTTGATDPDGTAD